MRVEFADLVLDRLETDTAFVASLPTHIVTAYRRRMQQLRAAVDERALYALKSLHFEKLKGKRDHERSIKLNDQWRLILELRTDVTQGQKFIWIVGVENHYR